MMGLRKLTQVLQISDLLHSIVVQMPNACSVLMTSLLPEHSDFILEIVRSLCHYVLYNIGQWHTFSGRTIHIMLFAKHG
jgi:hypothetical protein